MDRAPNGVLLVNPAFEGAIAVEPNDRNGENIGVEAVAGNENIGVEAVAGNENIGVEVVVDNENIGVGAFVEQNDRERPSLYRRYVEPLIAALIVAAAATPVFWGIVMASRKDGGTANWDIGMPAFPPSVSPTLAPTFAPTVWKPDCKLAPVENSVVSVVGRFGLPVAGKLPAFNIFYATQYNGSVSTPCNPDSRSWVSRLPNGSYNLRTDITIPTTYDDCYYTFNNKISNGYLNGPTMVQVEGQKCSSNDASVRQDIASDNVIYEVFGRS